MAENPRDDVVTRQYQKYRYPEPIQDLDTWTLENWQWYDPSHASRILWPDREYRPDLDILVAGCGTNQAAVFAYNNRDAKVLGVDVSQPSLDHQEYLKKKHGLTNLELQLLPIEELPKLKRDFDLVICTGVLMVLADPLVGMKALAKCVRKDGAIGLMLYAKYGRIGVELLQGLFRDLHLTQDDESVQMVRETLRLVNATHPVREYFPLAPELEFDTAIVDTFLHGREHSHSIGDCIDLVTSAGLKFQTLLRKGPYYPHELVNPPNKLYPMINTLPEPEIWGAMERVCTQNACHFFIATHAKRPEKSYTIDFADDAHRDYVPMYRHFCGLQGDTLYRPDWSMSLNEASLPFIQLVDGRRTIGEITDAVAMASTGRRAETAEIADFARRLFRGIWRLDFVAMALPGA